MKIGKKVDQNTWSLGEMSIGSCDSYTYLGDVITSDGKNTENIKNRKNKITATSISINSIASSEVLFKIETPVLLELHEKVNVPSLLSNSEAWTLLKSEESDIERAEVQCLKNLFDLPMKTPTPAVLFTFGILYTSVRVDQQKLIYLHVETHRIGLENLLIH